MQQGHQQLASDDEDRQNRFLNDNASEAIAHPVRERAASQPPRASDQNFLSSPTIPSGLGPGVPWVTPTQRMLNTSRGLPQSIPSRSTSFSNQSSSFSSVMRERSFSSTIEDDESEGLSDTYDERYLPPSLSPISRGRTYAQDISKSRSQSLATGRQGTIGGPYIGGSAMASWNESMLSNLPTSRYGEIKPPGASRQNADISNMSPFVRDVGQILLDEGSAFRELWAGMNPPRDENGGGGSGTTSRRHSVSVVQPQRRPIVGFNAPGNGEASNRASFSQANYGRSGLMLSDEDLAADLGMLNLSSKETSSQQPPSQPSSLPIYAPVSRSPVSNDIMSSYQAMNLAGSFTSRAHRESPVDDRVSPSHFDQLAENQYSRQQQQTPNQADLTARYLSGQGMQYMSSQSQLPTPINTNGVSNYSRTRAPSQSGGMTSPISPATRSFHQQPTQQQSFFPSPIQRRPSDATVSPSPLNRQPSLNELGKGVPLHAVPPSWPLYIVEFKAGRTDLFYLTELSQDIRVGDLVIVEADRGKDLGKVVNDTITLAEVEAFQRDREEAARAGAGFGDTPVSPGGSGGGSSGKKEINPKRIYGKAGPQDAQLLVTKLQDEVKALQLCQSKVKAKKLPMEVVDAEYQWDRRKLTFYFVAEKRIDFRELVRELFRLYKTRIWMASLQGTGSYEQ